MSETRPKSWNISDACVEDAEPLSRMHAQSWRDTYVGIQPEITQEWVEERVAKYKESPEAIERYKKHIHDAQLHPEKWFYKVAKDLSGEVVGFVLASKDSTSQHISSFYIDKSLQGSGLAQDFAENLMTWFDLGREVELEVAVNNDRARAFYEKLGFVVQPGTKKDFGGGLMEEKMIKPVGKEIEDEV